jgi:hypothetical protein
MKKPKYVRATLTLKPTKGAGVTSIKARKSLLGPLSGTLVIKHWEEDPCVRLEVEGLLEPKTTVRKPSRARARRGRK